MFTHKLYIFIVWRPGPLTTFTVYEKTKDGLLEIDMGYKYGVKNGTINIHGCKGLKDEKFYDIYRIVRANGWSRDFAIAVALKKIYYDKPS